MNDTDDLIIINKSGILIRLGVKDLRVMGRATQGVQTDQPADEDAIASVAKVEVDEAEEEGEDFEERSGEEIDRMMRSLNKLAKKLYNLYKLIFLLTN